MSSEIYLRSGARLSGAIVAICVAILLTDYIVATVRAPQDDKIIKALATQVREHPQVAPKLEAEEKRVTDARLARKKRDRIAGWVLLVSASVFLTCAKLAQKPATPLPHTPATERKPQNFRQWLKRRFRTRTEHRTKAAVVCDAIDLSYVDSVVAQYGRTREAAIPLLQAIQTHYRYLPDEALRRLCDLTEITPAEIAGTSTFYGQFRRSPVGEHIVRVCHGTACHVSGARQVTEELRRHLAIPEGADTDAERQFTIEEVACLGCCSLAPVLMVDSHTAGKLTPARACDALKPFEQEPA